MNIHLIIMGLIFEVGLFGRGKEDDLAAVRLL